MNAPTPHHPRRHGFMLLEVILALAVFSAAAVGFIVAIHRMAAVAQLSQSEMRITRILDSALYEAVSLPVLEEGTTTVTLVENDMQVATIIEIFDQLENQDGALLQDMFRIEIKATWRENDEWQQRTAETLRYGRMYQP